MLGLRTNITRKLGLTTNTVAVGYDGINQPANWSAKEAAGTLRHNEQEAYAYDAAGNLHIRTNDALVQTFNVDALNQLSNVTRLGQLTVTGATPVPATNVTVNTVTAQTYGDFTFAGGTNNLANGANTFTIIAQNIYTNFSTNILSVNLPTPVAFQYDASGNLTNDGTRYFQYDAENRLTNVTVAGQYQAVYVYDGFGLRRIRRAYAWQSSAWLKTNEIRYIYDGNLVIQERDTNNNVLVTYTRGLDLSGSLQRAGGIGGLLARTDANGTIYYHCDGNGNMTALIDANGNIVARYEYDAYGRLIGMWGPMAAANVYRFSSKEYDTLTGLYYFGGRYYDPVLQRWLNGDPIGERGGNNLYDFVGNNPITVVDRFGFEGNPVMGLDGAWNNDPYGPGGMPCGFVYGPGYLYPPAPPPQINGPFSAYWWFLAGGGQQAVVGPDLWSDVLKLQGLKPGAWNAEGGPMTLVVWPPWSPEQGYGAWSAPFATWNLDWGLGSFNYSCDGSIMSINKPSWGFGTFNNSILYPFVGWEGTPFPVFGSYTNH